LLLLIVNQECHARMLPVKLIVNQECHARMLPVK